MWSGSHLRSLEAGTWGELGVLPFEGYFLNFCWFPDLTQGKAAIDKKELYEVIYNEEIYEAIYDKEFYEAIYVQLPLLPVDDNDATLEEGQDKWGNVCVLYYFVTLITILSS